MMPRASHSTGCSVLATLVEATSAQRRVRIAYGRRSFEFDPYRVVAAGGVFRVAGVAAGTDELLLLEGEKIRSAACTGEAFETPAAFRPSASRRTAAAELRTSAGRVLRIPAGASPDLLDWVGGWDGALELLSPPALRRAVAQRLARALSLYRGAMTTAADGDGTLSW
jgi:hypothetical protein